MTDSDRIAGQKLRSFARDSCGFVQKYFGVTPDPWQAEALRAVDAGENPAIRSGHGVGKTTLLAWIVIQTLACYPFAKVPCTAPTQHQLRDLLWAEIAYWLNRSVLKDVLKWTATGLSMVGYPEAWFAAARASTRPENLAGFHAPKLRYIVDEASGVDDQIMAVVDGALTTAGAQCIMAGNPTRVSGYFYDAFHRARADWHCIHISSADSPRVSAEYPERMARKWGRDTDIYRVRVLGDFPSGESDAFISLALVEQAVARWHDARPDGPCEIGVDVARYGDDETVICIRRGGYVEPLEAHRQWSIPQTAGRVIELMRVLKPRAVKIDDTGLGGGVTDLVKEAVAQYGLNTDVAGCNFGGAGDDEDHYDNAATWWWANIRDMLRDSTLTLPDDEDLVAQLSTRRWSMTSKGKARLESKDDAKRRGLPSPDRADALALALASPQTAPVPRILLL